VPAQIAKLTLAVVRIRFRSPEKQGVEEAAQHLWTGLTPLKTREKCRNPAIFDLRLEAEFSSLDWSLGRHPAVVFSIK
jgi:hypothetical protein